MPQVEVTEQAPEVVAKRRRGVTVPRAVLTWRDVMQATGLARNTLRAEIADGRFPAQRQITKGRRGFLAVEFDQWLESRPRITAESAGAQPKAVRAGARASDRPQRSGPACSTSNAP